MIIMILIALFLLHLLKLFVELGFVEGRENGKLDQSYDCEQMDLLNLTP